MTGLTMTDCSVADNITQAKYELDRAMAASGYTQCAQWAMKWGRALLEVAAEHAGDGRDLESEIDDISSDLDATTDELRDAEDRIKELTDAIKSAISKLESEL